MNIQGFIVDIEKRRIYPGIVSVEKGKIVSITPLSHDALATDENKFRPYILPGFVDAHLHLEMTHAVPSEYARAALSQGTVAAVADCHDTVNVVGRRGVELYIRLSKKIPFTFGFSAPSTLAADRYSLADVEKLLSMKEVTHLGEIQNFPDVLMHEKYIQQLLALAKKYHKPVDGCSPGVSKERLEEYLDSGISTDHQCASYENALEKIEHDMFIVLQAKKMDSLSSLFPLFSYHSDRLMFSGQNMYVPAISAGYINAAVARAVSEGADLFGVLRAACITPVEHYSLPVGTLHEGDRADFILVDSMEEFNVIATYVKGQCVFSKRREFCAKRFRPMRIHGLNTWGARALDEKDLLVSALPHNAQKSMSVELRPAVNVIDICDGEVTTVRDLRFIREKGGLLQSDVEQDCLKVVIYDRYTKNTKPVVGFVHGFGIKRGGAAMSVSHDAHNIVAVGVADDDIALAINRVVSLRGGIALSVDKKVRADLSFPVCGLMSNLQLDELNKKFALLYDCFKKKMGCTLQHPIDTLSYIASPQLPSIKLSLEGLMNVVEQEVIPLVP